MDQAPAPTNPTNQLPLPDQWPGAQGIYKYSKQAVMLNLGTIIGIAALSFVTAIVLSLVLKAASLPPALVTLVTDLVTFGLAVAGTAAILASIKGRTITIGEALSQIGKHYVNYVIAAIVSGFLIGISFLLLIIPGFFVLPRLLLVTYFVVDQNMGGIEAVKASWAATKGNVSKVWGVLLMSLLFGILCIVLIGIYFSIMYGGAMALLYYYLTKQGGQTPAAAPAIPTNPVPPTPTPPVTNPTPPTV